MATADELLTNTTADTLTVDTVSRTIVIPATIKHVGVESDDEVTRLYFNMPRYHGEIDLSQFEFRINYLNANNEGDVYFIDDVGVVDDQITFSWLIGRFAVIRSGAVTFNICLVRTENGKVIQEFNTTTSTLSVLKGLETAESVVEDHPDAISGIVDTAIARATDIIPGLKAADGGEIFNDYENNQAIAEGSTARGIETQAGGYAFSLKEHTYSESDITDNENNHGKYYLNTTSGIVNGITYTVILTNNFSYNGTVLSVGVDYIEVDNYILPNQDATTTVHDGSYILFPDNKEIEGDVIIGTGAETSGYNTWAPAVGSNASGGSTRAPGKYGNSRGKGSVAGGYASDAANGGKALGHGSSARNLGTALAEYSDASGRDTIVRKNAKHSSARGTSTIAGSPFQDVSGVFNIEDTNGEFVVIIGVGTGEHNRLNGFTLDKKGIGVFLGDIIANGVSLTALNEAVGDIDAALDELHEYAQALANGGGTA